MGDMGAGDQTHVFLIEQHVILPTESPAISSASRTLGFLPSSVLVGGLAYTSLLALFLFAAYHVFYSSMFLALGDIRLSLLYTSL